MIALVLAGHNEFVADRGIGSIAHGPAGRRGPSSSPISGGLDAGRKGSDDLTEAAPVGGRGRRWSPLWSRPVPWQVSAASTSVTTVKAVSQPLKAVVNRYIQDNLRWNKDVYTVSSGGTLHIVNVASGEGPHTFTVVAKKDAPKNGPCRCSTARSARRSARRTAQIRTATLRRSSRSSRTASARRPRRPSTCPGDSGITGSGKKGEHIDLVVTAPSGIEALLHVPHPPVDAGGGGRQLTLGSWNRCGSEGAGGSRRPRPLRVRARSRRAGAARRSGAPGRAARRSTTGSPPSRSPGTSRPTGRTRSWAWTSRSRTR